MPIIEGIGDEVLYTFIVVLISIVVALVWMSTYVNPRDYNYLVYVDHYMFDMGRRLYQVVGGELTASNLAHLDTPRTNEGRVASSSFQPSAPLGTPEMSSSLSSDVIPSYTTSSTSNLPACDSSSSGLLTDTSSSSFGPVPVNQQKPENNTPSTCLHPKSTVTPTSSTTSTTATTATSSATATTIDHQPSTSRQDDDVVESANDLPHNNVSHHNNDATLNNGNDTTADDNIPDGHITIKLQFIDGTQRVVHANPDETIGEFKRRNFSAELDSRSTVRFIMSGQELKNESMSLRSYKVSHNIIIHCLILTSQQAPTSSSTSAATRQQRRGGLNDIGSLAFPIFGMGLGALWYARIFYRGYFNGASTVSLLAITFLYGLSLIASFRTASPSNQNHLHRD
ncbi:hypothetical protein HELRODRAFT_114448 [Helobdella robusta]|uniref:Ubiquitin-like domain-containing protein n=1 Tax=Helobdella robusta TaxID=6412 RepID=T1EG18_HELRO|nr:hypothetical protein HELRODRAFT_114448 [Helobdella robusta]ESN96911.1 hypothetical protein HELRODRAFT_114448 [Helobdella robusta]